MVACSSPFRVDRPLDIKRAGVGRVCQTNMRLRQFEASHVIMVREGVARHGNSAGVVTNAQLRPFRAVGMWEQGISEMLLVPFACFAAVQ